MVRDHSWRTTPLAPLNPAEKKKFWKNQNSKNQKYSAFGNISKNRPPESQNFFKVERLWDISERHFRQLAQSKTKIFGGFAPATPKHPRIFMIVTIFQLFYINLKHFTVKSWFMPKLKIFESKFSGVDFRIRAGYALQGDSTNVPQACPVFCS